MPTAGRRRGKLMATNMLGPALPDRHVLTLLSVPRRNSGHALVFMARFYGGLAHAVLLAEFEEPISGLEKPILLLVDYVHNRIERATLEDAV